jgi:transposase InsO family protein
MQQSIRLIRLEGSGRITDTLMSASGKDRYVTDFGACCALVRAAGNVKALHRMRLTQLLSAFGTPTHFAYIERRIKSEKQHHVSGNDHDHLTHHQQAYPHT